MKNLEEDAFRKGADSLILMEKAAEGICAQIKEMTDIRTARILFLCGSGNNGADGLAAARLLLNEGGKPCVFLAGEAKTPESVTQHRYCEYLSVPETDSLQFLSSYDLLVDALLGIGIGRMRVLNVHAIPSHRNTMREGRGNIPRGDGDHTVVIHNWYLLCGCGLIILRFFLFEKCANQDQICVLYI